MVFLLHLQVPWLSGGFVGVDIFFVISGYLITNLLVREIGNTGKVSFLNFYFRRTKRILPALLFTLVLCFICGALLFSAEHFQRLGSTIAASALSFSNFVFWSESGYFDTSSQYKPLLNTWSLGVEEQFYMFWPLFIYAFAYFFKEKLLPVFFLVLFSMSLGLNLFFQDKYPDALYYLMPFRIFEFCVGALMVWTKDLEIKVCRTLILETLCALGTSLMIYPAITFNSKTIFPSYNALIPCLGAALIIYAGSAKFLGMFYQNRAARHIGLISYSVYLVHWPMIKFYVYFKSADTTHSEKILIFIITLLIAHLMYTYIEQPLRNLNPKSERPFMHILYYVLAISAISALGCSVYFNKGWTWRLSKSVQETMAQLEGNFAGSSDPADSASKWGNTYGGAGFAGESGGWTFDSGMGSAQIVLVGDSFTQQLQYGFYRAIAKPHNISIYYVRTFQLPVPNLYNKNPPKGGILEDALEKLRQLPNSVLVMAARWDIRVQDDFRGNTGKKLSKKQAWNDADFSPLSSGFDELREKIGNRTLVIVGNVPSFSEATNGYVGNEGNKMYEKELFCSFRPYLGRLNCKQERKLNYNHKPFSIAINDFLRNYAERHENMNFVNPYDSLCVEKTYCNFFDEHGLPNYSDNIHLSSSASFQVVSENKYKIINML